MLRLIGQQSDRSPSQEIADACRPLDARSFPKFAAFWSHAPFRDCARRMDHAGRRSLLFAVDLLRHPATGHAPQHNIHYVVKPSSATIFVKPHSVAMVV